MGNCMVPGSVQTVSSIGGGEGKRKNSENRDSMSMSMDVVKSKSGNKSGGVRVKVVITKQELSQLLSNGLAMEDLLVELQARGQSIDCSPQKEEEKKEETVKSCGNTCGWRPALESIPEDTSHSF